MVSKIRTGAIIVAISLCLNSWLTAQPKQQTREASANTNNLQLQSRSPANKTTGIPQATKNAPQKKTKPVSKFTLSGRIHLEQGKRTGYLIVKAEIPAGNYIYALTQKGNPPPSKLTLKPNPNFIVTAPFTADRQPLVIAKDEVFNNRLEKHKQLVQFYAPIEIKTGIDPSKIVADLTFKGQMCSDKGTCMPIFGERVLASFAGYFQAKPQNLAKRPSGRQTKTQRIP